MKLKRRSERMQNIITGACELATIIAFFAAMYGLCLVLFAGGPQ